MVIVALAQGSIEAQTANGTAPQDAVCKVQKDEIEIYASFLKEKTVPHVQTVLVTKTGAYDVDVDEVNLQLAVKGHGIPVELRTDFKEKNKSSCLIEPFVGVMNLNFISTADRDRLFRTGWNEFHRKYGKDAVQVVLSRVAFNSEKTLALLHVAMGIDKMAAGGTLYLLEKRDGKWLIKSQIETWVT